MTWDYRIIDHGDHLALHEVFYDSDGKPRSHTLDPITFVCDPEDGPGGITRSLERALNCALFRDVLKASDFDHGSTDAIPPGFAGEPPLPDQQLANGGACS